MDHIQTSEIQHFFRKALTEGHIQSDDTSAVFHNLDYLDHKFFQIKSLFPANTLHAVALKANPLPLILKHLADSGAGAEAATLPEVYIAEQSGFKPDAIVFDSPAKTRHELSYALQKGIYINADSFDELDRIGSLSTGAVSPKVGIRVNPQVGMGTIALTSVAGAYSKFGVPLEESAERLLEYYKKYSWLRGVHLHIGSQGIRIDQLVEGVSRVYNFAEEVNAKLGNRQIHTFDIGGGFPVSYHWNQKPPSIERYSEKLLNACPRLFDGTYRLITEFGRFLFANSGWTATRVEYVKTYSGKKTAIVHIGGDLLMRRIYQPDDWYHEISVLDHEGKIKDTEKEEYVIAGPLCFAGDIISQGVLLPKLKEGDYLIIHDTGGYTLSMWNRHTSRQIPKVVGYRKSRQDTIYSLKNRESLIDVFRFWS